MLPHPHASATATASPLCSVPRCTPAPCSHPPREGHHTVRALFVAAVNDIHPGGDVRLPAGRSDVLIHWGRVCGDDLPWGAGRGREGQRVNAAILRQAGSEEVVGWGGWESRGDAVAIWCSLQGG